MAIDSSHKLAIRALPSLTDVAFVMPLLFVFIRLDGARTLLGDGDTGWHIRTGEWILANGRVPDRDIFSFTKPGEPWFAWEWLWDTAFGLVHRHWGMPAVVLCSLFVICLTSALLYRLCLRKSGNPLLSIAVTFLAMAGSSIHWLARPHLFTLLFTIVFYSLLEAVHDSGRTRLLWFLPAIMVLWTNVHGGFLVGIALVAVYAAGELATWLLDPEGAIRRAAAERVRKYGFAAAACAAATLINPYSYRLHIHLAAYFSDGFQNEHIAEFFSLNFHDPAARYFEIMIVVGLAAALWDLSRRSFVYPVLILVCMHEALVFARHIPIFLLVAAPVVARAVDGILWRLADAAVARWIRDLTRKVQQFAAELRLLESTGRVHLASAFVMAVLVLLSAAPHASAKFAAAYDSKKYPEKAIGFLSGSEYETGVFTDDEWGDFLIYRLYPHKVYVDGRSDFYGRKFSEEFLDIVNGKYNWEKALSRHDVRTVLLRADASLASTLKESGRWRVVYDDGVAIVFRSAADLCATPRTGSAEQVSAAPSGGVSVIARSPNMDRSDPRITNHARR